MEQIYSDLRDLMVDVFDEDKPISASTTAADFDNWDSLGNIRLFMAIESHFSIRFSTVEITDLKNVGELVDSIKAKVAGRQ